MSEPRVVGLCGDCGQPLIRLADDKAAACRCGKSDIPHDFFDANREMSPMRYVLHTIGAVSVILASMAWALLLNGLTMESLIAALIGGALAIGALCYEEDR